MREAPLSPHDRSTIIAQLAKTGQWEGTRAGHPIRVLRYRVKGGSEVIEYAVKVGFTWRDGRGATVADALEEINNIILTAKHGAVSLCRAQAADVPNAAADEPASLWQ